MGNTKNEKGKKKWEQEGIKTELEQELRGRGREQGGRRQERRGSETRVRGNDVSCFSSAAHCGYKRQKVITGVLNIVQKLRSHHNY